VLSLKHFRSLRSSLQSLIYLFWIYSFVSRAISVFSQLYIFELFDSVQLNIVAAMANFTGVMIGFCIYGAIAARYGLNVKHGFFYSFLLTALGIVLLPLADTASWACVTVMIRGIGLGLFWLTLHTYELSETRDLERDVYSTFLSAGDQILIFASPACATFLIWLSHRLSIGDYTLLFIATPAVFLLGAPSLGALKDYRPAPIKWRDLVHFFSDRRNQAAQIYLMGGSAAHILQHAVIPLATVVLLGNALNVGGFNTIFGIVGAIALLVVGSRRRPENRLFILGVTSIILVAFNLTLGVSLSVATLVVYAIGVSIAQPIMLVSQHVIDLKTMDGMGRADSDFYPTMIMRDVSIWVWRMTGALALLAFAGEAKTGQEAISIGMVLIAVSIAISYAGARILVMWKE
jgi:hypothetical protein